MASRKWTATALAAPALAGCLLDWDALQAPALGPTDAGTDTSTAPDSGPVVDAAADTTATPKDAAVLDAAPCDALVLINEVQTDGLNGASDEFVELLNTGKCDVSLVGWVLEYSSAAGSSPGVVWTGIAGDVIKPGGYFVVAGQQFPDAANGRFGNGLNGVLSKSGGGVGLFAPGASSAMDTVAWSTVTFPHPFSRPVGGPAAPNPPTKQSIARTPNGTNANKSAVDFLVATSPTPGAKN